MRLIDLDRSLAGNLIPTIKPGEYGVDCGFGNVFFITEKQILKNPENYIIAKKKVSFKRGKSWRRVRAGNEVA